MVGFTESVNYVNSLAESQPGFIWREKYEDKKLVQELWGEGFAYTLSLWQDTESLKSFLYRTPHAEFIRRGKEWFLPIKHPRVVLWWVPEGHIPTLSEAHERLELLYEHGASDLAFDLRSTEPPAVAY
ncbi:MULTISPECIES: DUF3291 domain-containing protein [Pseudomonas]|nr:MULTISPECIES: DUF3291 domain-containing protein [Pseudomonas]MDP5164233.1 DUF3291 domain-containing protein [Pseudomonas syringae pv. aptata str. DSM 50252]UOF22424.1 DUF3291 domain-containing protein [Pseudomonas syringae CC440]